MDIFDVLAMLGGLALFLYGMDMMGKGLERQAGNRLQAAELPLRHQTALVTGEFEGAFDGVAAVEPPGRYDPSCAASNRADPASS